MTEIRDLGAGRELHVGSFGLEADDGTIISQVKPADNRTGAPELLDRAIRTAAARPILWAYGSLLAALDLLPILASPAVDQIGYAIRYGNDARRFDPADPTLALTLTVIVLAALLYALVSSAVWLAGWFLMVQEGLGRQRYPRTAVVQLLRRWRAVVRTWATIVLPPIVVIGTGIVLSAMLVFVPAYASWLGALGFVASTFGIIGLAMALAVAVFVYPLVWFWLMVGVVLASRENGTTSAAGLTWQVISAAPGRLIATSLAVWIVGWLARNLLEWPLRNSIRAAVAASHVGDGPAILITDGIATLIVAGLIALLGTITAVRLVFFAMTVERAFQDSEPVPRAPVATL